VKVAFGRFKRFRKSGARLYVPDRLYRDADFPFEDGEVVKISIEEDRVVQEKAEWWALLDWSKLPDAYSKLPREIREAIEKQRTSRS